MAKAVEDGAAGRKTRLGNAGRDVLTLGIAIAAIILFVSTGSTVMPQIMRAWMGLGHAPDLALTNAMLLNIALLLFGWRRYKDLHEEIAERRDAEEAARELADIDPLTGCLNRRSGAPAINAMLRNARANGREVAVFMVDLDNFKQVNDLNGHQMGDRVLSTVAARIRKVLPANSVITRIGGDEFVCAVPCDAGDREQVEMLAEQIISSTSLPIELGHVVVEATISLGAAWSEHRNPDGSESGAEALIHRADIAMYHAKKGGRNRFCWFEPVLEEELRFRNELETAIRRGIPAGEFVPYYEQQIDLQTGELTGFEMLARWNSPDYGLVTPEVFIPVAEDIDLISDLSEMLIRQALQDARDWHPSLTLSVNISPLQLRDPWFAQKLLHLLVESGFPPSRLEIEITESCLLENIGAVRTIISSLKNQGIRVSLDDFGTGYSSLSQLRNLPFDRLKIDKSFVADLAREGGTSELVGAIMSLGKVLNLPVTAEGIEDHAALDALTAMKGLGQLKGQGYLYGRPEDAETTRQRLEGMKLLSGIAEQPGAKPAPAPITAEHEQALQILAGRRAG